MVYAILQYVIPLALLGETLSGAGVPYGLESTLRIPVSAQTDKAGERNLQAQGDARQDFVHEFICGDTGPYKLFETWASNKVTALPVAAFVVRFPKRLPRVGVLVTLLYTAGNTAHAWLTPYCTHAAAIDLKFSFCVALSSESSQAPD